MRHFNLGARLGDLRRFISGKIKLIYHLCRLSVSESSEWVCTKTIFTNGSVVRGCHKTYTGNFSGKIATSSIALQCVLVVILLSSSSFYPPITLCFLQSSSMWLKSFSSEPKLITKVWLNFNDVFYSYLTGGETFSMCFWSDIEGKWWYQILKVFTIKIISLYKKISFSILFSKVWWFDPWSKWKKNRGPCNSRYKLNMDF